jgi:hypothetical protein
MAPTQGSSEQDPAEMTGGFFLEREPDFSLVVGGPLFQLLRKSHLTGDALELAHRRVVAICAIAWLPPLLLVLASAGKAGLVLFRHDVEVHARILVALPVLILGELLAHARIRASVRAFVTRGLISEDDRPCFDHLIESAVRLRNSALVQIAILILVYTVGLWHWHNRVPLMAETWYASAGGRGRLTPAGYWYVYVSIPIVQFLLLCWYWRFFVWSRFLWQVSRIRLNLVSIHPDHCGGLAFLGMSAYGFGPILFAQGTMLAGVVASRILYRGESLMSFRLPIFEFVVFFMLAVLGPLLLFTRQLAAVRRKGLAIYGKLGQNYAENFEHKWAVRGPKSVEDLLGNADIQSLADLSNSYSIVSSMRIVPFDLTDVTRLAAVTAASFLPLLLTVFSPEELIMRLIDAIF